MGQIQRVEAHGQRLQQARQLFFAQGTPPEGLLDPLIIRSWERCRRFGLGENSTSPGLQPMDRVALKTEQERNRYLLQQSRPIMEHVFEQIRDSGSMVILADANGLLLETVGDADFVGRADRVALSAGASWDENLRGTNAIGTALSEEMPVAVLGSEHFLEYNGFLTCCASPIFGPDGRLIGVLDISGDYRSHQRHTLGLARLSSAIVEKRLFEAAHGRDILVCFHSRADYLGSPKEGMAAVSPDGQVLAINRNGTELLGIRPVDAVRRDFSMVFESNLSTLVDRLRHHPQASGEIHVNGKAIHVQLRGQLPPLAVAGRVFDEVPATRPARRPEAGSTPRLTLDTLNTGDTRLQAVIDRTRRLLGRDIPILIQGESGAGKEMLAKAFHNSGPRRDAPFVALNCASIPETLIESELFGYQGGAFTGARKEGAPGKIQQAHGGTLFLDEIGDMPLNLQARLLRVLQERCVTPLGSTRTVQVDISLVCATHRKLREEVARGHFREDLYYRLNGMSVTLPALRPGHRHPCPGRQAGRRGNGFARRRGAVLGRRPARHRRLWLAGQHPSVVQRHPGRHCPARRR
jgi:transcriptional regulator of acetoin/glycerol metabolism